MRAALAVAVGAGVLLAPAPAWADSVRMSLACQGSDLVLERSNGASWWGSDGSVWTTRRLQVVDDSGTYVKEYGDPRTASFTCVAPHDVEGYRSTWTVELVQAR